MSKFNSKTNLGRLLEIEMAGPYERKFKIEQLPKELAYRAPDGKAHRVKELLLSDAIASTTLIQEQVHSEIMEGAKIFTCFREAVPIYQCKSNSLRLVKGAAGGYAEEVAEGAIIPGGNQAYAKVDLTIKKVGVNAGITEEMLEDGLFDVVGSELRYAGEAIENKLNRDVLSSMLQNSGLEWDTTATNQGIKGLVKAIGLVRGAGFEPDTVVMHPSAYTITLLDYVPSYNESAEAVLRGGKLPMMAGLNSYQYGGVEDSTTYNWNYAADGDIGMLVFNKRSAGAIAMNRDITVKEMKDPVRDIVNLPVTMRYGTSYVHANAISRVEF